MSLAEQQGNRIQAATGRIVSFKSGVGRMDSGKDQFTFSLGQCDPTLRKQLSELSETGLRVRTSPLLLEMFVTPQRKELRYIYNFSASGRTNNRAFAQYLLDLCQLYPDQIRVSDVKLTTAMLSGSGLLNGATIDRLVQSDFGKNPDNLSRLASALSPAQTDRLTQELSLDKKAAIYCLNTPGWKQLATAVWGQARVETFLAERRLELEREVARQKEEDRQRVVALQQTQLEYARNASTQLDKLRLAFRANPKGIRDERRLTTLCLECGSAAVRLKSRWACSHCEISWYSNHCWNCKKLANVDSRDPATPSCPGCDWCKCARCGACKPGCAVRIDIPVFEEDNRMWRGEGMKIGDLPL